VSHLSIVRPTRRQGAAIERDAPHLGPHAPHGDVLEQVFPVHSGARGADSTHGQVWMVRLSIDVHTIESAGKRRFQAAELSGALAHSDPQRARVSRRGKGAEAVPLDFERLEVQRLGKAPPQIGYLGLGNLT
jgi:hypothetical protein